MALSSTLVPNVDIETVRIVGGGTFDHDRNPLMPTEGFLVATHSILFAWHSLDDVWHELQFHYWPDDYSNNLLGFWRDPETGFWYVDFVIHTYSAVYANSVCVERGEVAYFDCKTGESVRVH